MYVVSDIHINDSQNVKQFNGVQKTLDQLHLFEFEYVLQKLWNINRFQIEFINFANWGYF